MGYWNGYSNYADWAEATGHIKVCEHCGDEFIPKSGRQRYCSREDSPECDDDRISEAAWNKGKHPLQVLFADSVIMRVLRKH